MSIEAVLFLLAVFIVVVAILGLIAVAFLDRKKSKGLWILNRRRPKPDDSSHRGPRS